MLSKILKGDLKRRKGVNIIIFFFVLLATVFLASSMNNITTVMSATDYYMNYAHVPDMTVIVNDEIEGDKLIKSLKDSEHVTACEKDIIYALQESSLKACNSDGEKKYNADGLSIYIGTYDSSYFKVYDPDGNKFTLKDGEIAVSKTILDDNDLKIGDTIKIKIDDFNKEYKIAQQIKDFAFGSKLCGMQRLIVNENEIKDIEEGNPYNANELIFVDSDDNNSVTEIINNSNSTSVLASLSKDVYSMVYIFDVVVAGLLVLIGICLILIALLVLRFTIVFTLEEDYKEIGIMKASGFKNSAISKIYLIKYFAIVFTASITGMFISIPIGNAMLDSVSQNIIMDNNSNRLMINVISMIFIVAIIMLFCYGCTRKVYKISAVQAIRNGQSGERFTKLKGFKLHSKKKLSVINFLAINDIKSNIKRYIMLIITFCISFVLITIPLNTLTTMSSSEMSRKFSIDPDIKVNISNFQPKGRQYTEDNFDKDMDIIENALNNKGYNGKLSAALMYSPKYYKKGEKNLAKSIITLKLIDNDGEFLDYFEGSAPKYANEMAVSKQVMKDNDWEIGDTIITQINDREEEMIITGVFSDYMQQGNSIRVNSNINYKDLNICSVWKIMYDIDTDKEAKDIVQELRNEIPDYEWDTPQDIVDKNVGGVKDSMDAMQIPMTALLAGVIMLITILMETLFIIREKGEIAMMKSIGFKNRHIRMWQALRMICVMLVSMVLSVPLSMLSNQFVLKPVFAIMGAELKIQVEPLLAYLVYPAVLLIAIVTATIIATRKVKNIDIREMNNLE